MGMFQTGIGVSLYTGEWKVASCTVIDSCRKRFVMNCASQAI